jgi:hypothetical protein
MEDKDKISLLAIMERKTPVKRLNIKKLNIHRKNISNFTWCS